MEPATVEMITDEIETKEPKEAIVLQQSAALNLLTQYSDSENENDSNEEVKEPEDHSNQYRTAELDSSSSSSSSDSDDEIDVKEIKKKLETVASDDDSENENDDPAKERKKKQPLKVRGEFLLEDLPPIQDLELKVDEKECLEIGTITSIVDQLVLVEAYPHSAALDIDSVLFLDNGKKALGQIFDVIGQVSTPIYCIRFNTHEDIVSKNITVGSKVFCAPRTEYANFVIISKIMGKGSDASWKNDIEIPENMIEYSDDEEERSARRQKKNPDRNPDQQATAPRRRNHSQNYSWHNQINNQPPNNWHNQQPQPQPQPHQPQFQNYNFYPQNPYNM
ncbi:H/ACA ribonucleoprotein complex non-core subunit NAF1 [Chironomus tepperi]|uniref:H/ACA ribonucleoprotein complex non-core subunit NAF1 n=1 Tax=Chironomus tepperi TaxID=113505 RepID=UPI00391F7F62